MVLPYHGQPTSCYIYMKVIYQSPEHSMIVNCAIKDKSDSQDDKINSDFSFVIHHNASSINESIWNAVTGKKNHFLQPDYLVCLEENSDKKINFHYVIIYDRERPVAIAYFQVMDLSIANFGSSVNRKKNCDIFLSEYIKRQFKNYLKKTASKLKFRLLICGNAFISGENSISYIENINTTQLFNALNKAIKKISEIEKTNGKIAAIMIKDFYNASFNNFRELEEFKYKDFFVEPNMIIKIHWKSFAEYLNSMNKKYRSRAKNIIKKGQEIERKNLSTDEIKNQSEAIFGLYQQVRTKAKFKMGDLTINYFSSMKSALGDNFLFTAYYKKNQMIGFKTAFINKTKIEAHFIGIDYDVNQQFELYQNMLYDYVGEAIELNVTSLSLGRTASEIKSAIGAEAQELTCYIRHRNSLSNSMLSYLLHYLKPADWVPRKPFKQNTSSLN